MIYLLILAYWIYFLGEGITESMTWKANWTAWLITPRTYHIWRLIENLGVIGALFLTYYFHPSNWLIISLLSAVTGLVIYERVFCLVRYNNFWHQKTSKYFCFNHPKVWLEVVLFVIAFIGLIIII